MKLTYEAYVKDPAVRERLVADAHRMRAQEVNRLFGLIARHVKGLYAARPHLARQG